MGGERVKTDNPVSTSSDADQGRGRFSRGRHDCPMVPYSSITHVLYIQKRRRRTSRVIPRRSNQSYSRLSGPCQTHQPLLVKPLDKHIQHGSARMTGSGAAGAALPVAVTHLKSWRTGREVAEAAGRP